MTAWNDIDLARRLGQALDIAAQAASAPRPRAFVADTALLLLAARHAGRAYRSIGTRIDRTARLLEPHARGERARAGVCFDPAQARDYGFAHICLTRLGYTDAAFDRLLVQGLSAEAAGARERLPHRALEQQWLSIDDGPGSPRTGVGRQWAALAAIGSPFDALTATRRDLHAFTRALMYVTDLGAQHVVLPRARRALLADADGALARCLDDQEYDLAGETLLAWPYLRAQWSAAATFGFTVLMRVGDAGGLLPPANARGDRDPAIGERLPRTLADGYRTTYIVGLLCAAALRPGCRPSVTVPRAAPTSVAGALLLALEEDGGSRHWCEDFRDLEGSEQAALVPLLLTMALRRAAARRDFPRLRLLLDLARRHGLNTAPAPRQAAELLTRAELLADSCGRRRRIDVAVTAELCCAQTRGAGCA